MQRFSSGLPLVARAAALVGANQRLTLAYALFLIWLQLPIGAVPLAFARLTPYLDGTSPLGLLGGLFRGGSNAPGGYPEAVGGRGALTGGPVATAGRLAAGLQALTYVGVLSEQSVRSLSEFCADGWVLLFLVFLGTPGFITRIGCLLAGLVWPAACSTLLVSRHGAADLLIQARWETRP